VVKFRPLPSDPCLAFAVTPTVSRVHLFQVDAVSVEALDNVANVELTPALAVNRPFETLTAPSFRTVNSAVCDEFSAPKAYVAFVAPAPRTKRFQPATGVRPTVALPAV